jgi:hypothetical protein
MHNAGIIASISTIPLSPFLARKGEKRSETGKPEARKCLWFPGFHTFRPFPPPLPRQPEVRTARQLCFVNTLSK